MSIDETGPETVFKALLIIPRHIDDRGLPAFKEWSNAAAEATAGYWKVARSQIYILSAEVETFDLENFKGKTTVMAVMAGTYHPGQLPIDTELLKTVTGQSKDQFRPAEGIFPEVTDRLIKLGFAFTAALISEQRSLTLWSVDMETSSRSDKVSLDKKLDYRYLGPKIQP